MPSGPGERYDFFLSRRGSMAAIAREVADVLTEKFVVAGRLSSYGMYTIDQYRRAAGYVDRILKGEKPADLPVQAPTKYELAINMKTAKALGLDVPVRRGGVDQSQRYG
jgi:putative ABC transport system substrate-binding protein